MNLEDRLRSHMHSGQDLFVEGDRNSADISAAGHRRNRRNQLAYGAVAGVAVLALAFGASSLQDSGTGQFATEGASTESANSATDGAGETSADEFATEFFDGPTSIVFDAVVGVDDGLVGLRNRGGTITAITSDDGVIWDERTTDLPVDVARMSLAHGDGVFATSIQTEGPSSGQMITSIATSTDLESWTVVEVAPPSGVDLSLLGLSVHEGMVVAPVTLFPRQDGNEDESAGRSIERSAVLAGPVRGPYELTETTDLFTVTLGVTATDEGVASWVIGNNGFAVITPDDSAVWQEVSLPDPELALTGISTVDGDLVVFGTRDGVEAYRSPDNGLTWIQLELPPDLVDVNWQGTTVQTNGQTAAVRLSGPGENGSSRSALLVSRGDAFTEVDLTAHMTAEQIENSMLLATSDEEALFEFFGSPSDDPSLAASSGVAPEEDEEDAASEGAASAPGYISVPLS